MIFELIPTTVRMSTPLALAALGGIYSERSGVVNIGLEGMMLMGAFGYVTGASAFASPWMGFVIGVGFGSTIALFHAIASISFRADQIVSGVAINLLAIGITEFLGRGATSQRVGGLSHWELPLVGSYSILVYLTPVLVVMSQILLFRTVWGLRLCAAGESTEALDALGLRRSKWQYIGVMISGTLTATGGCFLASEAHYFTKGMTAGRGYVALAAVIFGKWKPFGAGAACLLFGFASALELASRWRIPPQLLNSLPYLLTMIVLVGVIGKAIPPASLGKHE
ncbi:MAG: ABC transporter permease [Candidatus Poribacteria bacterium]|nr:ABC transporter permease [Candidatus Poribacteria bacterium]